VKLEERLVSHLSHHFDKWLLAGGIFYLCGVSLWLGQQNRLTFSSLWGQASPSITLKSSPSAADRQFISYLQQSLKVIEQSPLPHSQSSPVVSPSVSNPATLPTLTIQSARPAPLPPIVPVPRVVEKYYYPVYPSVTTPEPRVTVLQQRVSSAISPPYSPLSPLPTMPPSLAIAPNISPLVTGKATYSLVGVLESGDRSSALFNWNGLTQRVQIGEPLGASGWVLKSVNSQKAILSRQGKTRYLEVGQRF
jgi:hypothetical protein